MRDIVLLELPGPRCISTCFVILVFLFSIPLQIHPQTTDIPIRTLTLRELYGVSHPPQIVTFDGGGGLNPLGMYMIGPGGVEVPYQVMKDGTIAVQTDLPARSQRSWRLYAGRQPVKFPDLIEMRVENSYYEITNGMIGVRITRGEGNGDTRLAPIQGIQMKNGQWTATGPNYIGVGGTNAPTPLAALGVTTQIVEMGPLQVTVQVSYRYNRPDLVYNTLLIPGGTGSYKSTIQLQAGQPSILIEDDTGMDLQYSLNVYYAVQPD